MARALLRNISDHRAEWTVFFGELVALTGERRAESAVSLPETATSNTAAVERRARASEGGLLTDVTPLQVKGILGAAQLHLSMARSAPGA